MAITRRDAAQQLLDEAIRLWLDARNPLAVHMLTMAPFRVLFDLHQHEDTDAYIRLKGELSNIGFSRLYALSNKLKHADRDPEEPFSVPSNEDNEWRIGMALVMYRNLEGDLTPEMGAFHLMSLSAFPDNFKVVADEDPDIEAGAQMTASLLRGDVESRRMIVRSFLKLIVEGLLPANINLRRR